MKIGLKIVQKKKKKKKWMSHVGEEKMDDYISKCFHGCSSKQRRENLFICLSSFAFRTIACEFIIIIMARRRCFFLIRSLREHFAREWKGFLILDEKELNHTILVLRRQMCILKLSSLLCRPFILCSANNHIILFFSRRMRSIWGYFHWSFNTASGTILCTEDLKQSSSTMNN